MKKHLSSLELLLYFFIWTFANCYTLFKLFEAQTELLKYKLDLKLFSDLKPGWSFISRLQDVSDIEWSSWKYFFHNSWYCLLSQFFISEVIRRWEPILLKYWYILSSVIFIAIQMDVRQLLIILVQPFIFLLMILSGARKITIWVTSIFILLSYNTLKYKHFFWHFLDKDDLQDEEVYLMFFCVAWVELRCISFSINHVESQKEIDEKYENEKPIASDYDTAIDMMSYVLYAPLLYMGPLMMYEEFEKSFHVTHEPLARRLRKFIKDMFLFLFYSFILDLSLHYIYFLAMQSEKNIETIRDFPSLALCGGGLWMGLEFHMKYVISYGIAAAFSRLDNLEPPPTPRCIARVHVYSQMWRYFDVGLYRFLIKYIYKPALSNISKWPTYKLPPVINKQIASLVTFIFIFLWHGTIWDIFVWSILNYFGITLEQLGKSLSKSNAYRTFREKVLRTDAMETRFIAVLCTPLLALSAISNFYLFAGSEVGSLFFECFAHPSFLTSLIVSVSLYSCCHVGMALEDVPSRFEIKKSNEKEF